MSASVEDVAMSIIPSLTIPVERRLETSVPGVSFLLPEAEVADLSIVIETANKMLIKECKSKISSLRTELEDLETERSELLGREKLYSDVLVAILFQTDAKKKANKSSRSNPCAPHKDTTKSPKMTRNGFLFPDEKSPFHGENLAAARKKKNLTQGEASEWLGIHRVTLSAIECGRKPVDERLILKLAKLYDMSG